MDHKIKKWRSWLGKVDNKNTITYDIISLSLRRDIYYGVKDMIKNNPELKNQPSAFWQYFAKTYADSILLAIRRQVTVQKDSKSLIRIVKDIKDNAHLVTREYYTNLYQQPDSFAERDFDREFAGEVGSHLDPNVLDIELQKLMGVYNNTKSYVNRRLAHLDKREPTYIPTYKEINEYCDLIIEVFKRLQLLLFAVDFQVKPHLNHDWRAIFKTAWME